jgi:phosphoglycerol transferase MdoB-like AlkP superfamily enzyme
MGEAYWDPTRLPSITFSEDPVPNLRKLQTTATFGNVLSPSFGGMTSNVEFELLTGNAMRFAGLGNIPYYEPKTYIENDNGRSLINMFKANGYRTVALHTYEASFFDRDTNYSAMGFDRFISADDMPYAQYKGTLNGQDIISDEYFCDELIDLMENVDDPLFLFGITMQNHTPYLPDKYEETHIKAYSNGLLSDEDITVMESYLEGVYDTDRVLGRLYDFVMETEEPTILVFFGDHLPLLTQRTGVYTDLGYIDSAEFDDLTAEDAYKMFTTPYLAFSNYMELPETWGSVSPYFLGAVVADAADIDMNLYYTFLLQAYESFQGLNNYVYISGDRIFSEPQGSIALEMFEAFQYDKLFGEDHLGAEMSSYP